MFLAASFPVSFLNMCPILFSAQKVCGCLRPSSESREAPSRPAFSAQTVDGTRRLSRPFHWSKDFDCSSTSILTGGSKTTTLTPFVDGVTDLATIRAQKQETAASSMEFVPLNATVLGGRGVVRASGRVRHDGWVGFTLGALLECLFACSESGRGAAQGSSR